MLKRAQLAARIDHTVLKPEALASEVDTVIGEAISHRFASVCIAPVWVGRTVAALRGAGGVLTCTVAGFPHGTSTALQKARESAELAELGADEVDVVAHLPYLLRGDLDAARRELDTVVAACRARRQEVVIKVIVESACLMTLGAGPGEAAIAMACQAVRESGCDFIKTSTGFHPAGGATLEAVRLMKRHGHGLRIKAAGGIRDLATALAMLDAGADRLGMSASVAVLSAVAE